jgi:hypothetical protein
MLGVYVTWVNWLFVVVGLFVFVNSVEDGIVNVYVTVIKVFILFKCAKDMEPF